MKLMRVGLAFMLVRRLIEDRTGHLISTDTREMTMRGNNMTPQGGRRLVKAIIGVVALAGPLQAGSESDLFGESGMGSQTVQRAEILTDKMGHGPATNPFRGLNPDEISRVVIVAADRIRTKQERDEKPTEVVITNRKVIANMVEALSRAPTNNVPTPLIGTLGDQFFFGRTGEEVAVTSIVNYRATVYVQRPRRFPAVACEGFRCEQFCRLVYGIMKASLPDEIEAQNACYRQTPFGSVENLLFSGEAPPGEARETHSQQATNTVRH